MQEIESPLGNEQQRQSGGIFFLMISVGQNKNYWPTILALDPKKQFRP